jgi:hypothetical protein
VLNDDPDRAFAARVGRCALLDVTRSTAYYRLASVSDDDLARMRLIDEIHLELLFYGSRRLVDALQRP